MIPKVVVYFRSCYIQIGIGLPDVYNRFRSRSNLSTYKVLKRYIMNKIINVKIKTLLSLSSVGKFMIKIQNLLCVLIDTLIFNVSLSLHVCHNHSHPIVAKWLNRSFDSFKVKCKEFFLNWRTSIIKIPWRYLGHIINKLCLTLFQ